MSGIKELLFSIMEQEHEIAKRRKELFEQSDFGLEEAEEQFEEQQPEPSMPEVRDWVKTHDKDAYV